MDFGALRLVNDLYCWISWTFGFGVLYGILDLEVWILTATGIYLDFSQAWSGLLLLRSQWQRNAALAIVAVFVRGVDVRGQANAARTVFPVITVSARIRASRGRPLSLPPHLPFGVAVNHLVLCPFYSIPFFLACLHRLLPVRH